MEEELPVLKIAEIIDQYASHIHELNRKWWHDPVTGDFLHSRNVGEMIALIHSELSEALEGHRKGLMDSHIPDRQSLEVELADAIIRIFDLSAGLRLNIGQAIVEKLEYNKHREDHKTENRLKPGGKAY